MTELKEVVVVDAVRSAIGKSGRKGMEKGGMLCQASAQDLVAAVMRGLLDRVKAKAPNFDEREIEDVIIGCLSQVGEQGGNIGRIASLLAGIPDEASGCTVNQYCNAGLKAINMATRALKCGDGEIMLCAGVELMSHYPMASDIQIGFQANYPVRMTTRLQETGMTVPQGVCAEMISKDEGHTREDLDKFGMWSMQKAVEADRKGWFADHIIPFEFEWEGKKYKAEKDETLRPKAVDDPAGFWDDLKKLKPPFQPEDGRVTAGNSSQIVDGAAAVLLMTAEKAEKLGLEPMARILSHASAGGAPVPMLLAPIPAVYKALKRAGNLTIDQMDVIEPNEAFASPCLAFANEFKYAYDDPRVNPTGGAIALGHPIGASGIIYFTEMLYHLKRTSGRYGLQMLCGGGGIGIASVVERL
jgi:acetyl-CoA acyltransferase